MRKRPLLLGLQLGLFQLGLGIFGVLAFGLFNRLLIEEFQLPAVMVAAAIGSQQLTGFTRVWFGYRSDRIPVSRLRRTPFIVCSSFFWRCCLGLPANWCCSSDASWREQGQQICPG